MENKVTILTTWSDEILEIEAPMQVWMEEKLKAKNKWEDWIYLKKYDRYLKFSNIKDEQGKTKYLALEEAKEEFKEFSPEERKKITEEVKRGLELTREWRLKRFVRRRQEILEQLAKEEKYFDLETTISKLRKYRELNKNNLLNNN